MSVDYQYQSQLQELRKKWKEHPELRSRIELQARVLTGEESGGYFIPGRSAHTARSEVLKQD